MQLKEMILNILAKEERLKRYRDRVKQYNQNIDNKQMSNWCRLYGNKDKGINLISERNTLAQKEH